MDDTAREPPDPVSPVQFGLRKLFYLSTAISVWLAAGTGFGPLGLALLPAAAAFIAWLAGLIPLRDLIIVLLLSYAAAAAVLSHG